MDLHDYAHALGVQVARGVPSGNRWGSYHHRTRSILLHPGLSPRQESYVLGHELAHAYYGHDDCLPQWERQADLLAATWLIRAPEWRTAVRIHSTIRGVADELDVHPWLVRVYAEQMGDTPT